MDFKLTSVFVQAYTYWNDTYFVLENKEGDLKELIASSVYLTSNFAFSCELYLKGVLGYLNNDSTKASFKSYGHDLYKLFNHLPLEVQNIIKDEYLKIIKVFKAKYFNKNTDFDLALIQSRKSFEECRYFFEKADKNEPGYIHFYFLSAFAIAIHFYVLDNTDFDLEKTKLQLMKKQAKLSEYF